MGGTVEPLECAATPLCPAGHLPLKGGDWQDALPPQSAPSVMGDAPPRFDLPP